MSVKLKTTKDLHDNGIKVVVYGSSGIGKTVLCGTAPNPIIISAEKGLLSLQDKDIPYIEVDSLQSLNDAYNYCLTSDYQTICLDSLSEIATKSLNLLLIKAKQEATGNIDPRQSYGKLAEYVGTMIRNYRDMENKNVIFVAKQRRYEDEDGVVTFEPYIPGKVLPFDLPYLVDEVFCMRMDRKGTRFLQTATERRYVAKDRSGKLDKAEMPNLTDIFNKIRGNT